MKSLATITVAAVAALAISAGTARAQHDTTNKTVVTSSGDIEFVGPLGYRLRPGGAPIYCNENDVEEVRKVTIDADKYREGMITADQAKALALCAVPGQIGSGEMDTSDGRTVYDITLIPNDKKTYSKVQIDAYTGEIINAKQFGGLRGLAGFLRESAQRKANKGREPNKP